MKTIKIVISQINRNIFTIYNIILCCAFRYYNIAETGDDRLREGDRSTVMIMIAGIPSMQEIVWGRLDTNWDSDPYAHRKIIEN